MTYENDDDNDDINTIIIIIIIIKIKLSMLNDVLLDNNDDDDHKWNPKILQKNYSFVVFVVFIVTNEKQKTLTL